MAHIFYEEFEKLVSDYSNAISREDKIIKQHLESIVSDYSEWCEELCEFADDITLKFSIIISLLKQQYERKINTNKREYEEKLSKISKEYEEKIAAINFEYEKLYSNTENRRSNYVSYGDSNNIEHVPYEFGDELLVAFYNRYTTLHFLW